MRGANLPTVLLGVLGAVLLLVLPAGAAAAAITSVTMSDTEWVFDTTPAAFSLTPSEPRRSPARAPRAAPAQHVRLFGYPSARAEEFVPPPAPAAPTLLFSHAALGVAMLDTPPAGGDGVATADSGHLNAAQLALTVPATTRTILPSPLPIALILAMVLLPAGLVLGQALRGPSRRPRPAMRRHTASRRDNNG